MMKISLNLEENELIPTPKTPVIFTESLINAPDDVTLEYSSSQDLSYTSKRSEGRFSRPMRKLEEVLGAV